MTHHKIIIGDARDITKLIPEQSVQLVVTSPPYAHIKDYGVDNQIGFGSSYDEYIKELTKVWEQCYKVLEDGCRLIINVGDVYNTTFLKRHKAFPIHANIITECEKTGFDYMGQIIWHKIGNVNPSGGASVMGSFPYPRNGIVEYSYEYIMIFKKQGKQKITLPENIDDILKTHNISKEQWIKRVKQKSAMTIQEWREFFSSHWKFPGIQQKEHIAMFPDELPRRIIKMFSFAAVPEIGFAGDVVLDPFLGSGTTMKVARELNRNSIGIELNPQFLDIIKEKVGVAQKTLDNDDTTFEIIKARTNS